MQVIQFNFVWKTFDHNSKKGLTRDDVVHQCCGHAKDANQQVTDGQVENEEIGDRTHVLAPQHDKAHNSISHHAHNKDEEVGYNEDSRHQGLMQIEVHIGDVWIMVWTRGGTVH